MTTTTRRIQPEAAQYEERVARAIAEEDACQEATIEQARRLIAAGDEPGFSGDLRRAIHSGGRPVKQIAERAQIESLRLSEFLCGEVELTSTEIHRLVQELGLQLMRPIESKSRRVR